MREINELNMHQVFSQVHMYIVDKLALHICANTV